MPKGTDAVGKAPYSLKEPRRCKCGCGETFVSGRADKRYVARKHKDRDRYLEKKRLRDAFTNLVSECQDLCQREGWM